MNGCAPPKSKFFGLDLQIPDDGLSLAEKREIAEAVSVLIEQKLAEIQYRNTL